MDEGHVRELIRAIQDTRKKLDLPIEQYIAIYLSATDPTKDKIKGFEELIKENVLVHTISFEEHTNLETQIELNFGDEIIKVSLGY